MAGYIIQLHKDLAPEDISYSGGFWIGDPTVATEIRAHAPHPRVITLQLDGDELDAALWGLTNYRKGVSARV